MKIRLIFIFLSAVSCFIYSSCKKKESEVKNNEGKQVSKTQNSNSSLQSGNIDNSKYSGLYQGVYFYIAEATTTRLENIYPVLLINDTCSVLYFGKTLIKDFKIVNNVIKYPNYSFVGGGDTNKIYIDTSEIKIPYNDYEIKYNMSSDSEKYESADGKIYKISEISDRDLFILNEAIKENNNFFKYFWGDFI